MRALATRMRSRRWLRFAHFVREPQATVGMSKSRDPAAAAKTAGGGVSLLPEALRSRRRKRAARPGRDLSFRWKLKGGDIISEVCTKRNAAPDSAGRGPVGRGYFGHPFAGFFFASDFFTAACQLPLSLSVSGAGPGLGLRFFGMVKYDRRDSNPQNTFVPRDSKEVSRVCQFRHGRATTLARIAAKVSGATPFVVRVLSVRPL